MKKTLLTIFVSLLVGAGATWFVVHSGAAPAADAAKADAAPADAAAEPGKVHWESEEQEKADLKMATPTLYEYKIETKGYARVLDPAPLISELGDLEAATASADASAKELARQQKLSASDNASARTLEAAIAAAKRDQVQLDSLHAHLLSDWGPVLTARTDLPQLLHSLLAREAALVRVDIPSGEKLPPEPRELKIAPSVGDGAPVTAELLGPAASADAQVQGTALLGLVRDNPPVPGTQLLAWLTSTADGQKGLRLPQKAIVVYDSDTFIYVQTNSEDFERWRVKLGPTLRDGGVFVTGGVTAQDHVVVNGAAQLLSDELKSMTGGGD